MEDQNTTQNNQKQDPDEIKLFDNFIDKFIINKKSLLDENKVFKTEDIAKCLDSIKTCEIMNKQSDCNNDKSLETALDNLSVNDDKYTLLWHCYYIMYLMGDTAKKFFKLTIKKEDLFVEKGKGAASTNQLYNSNAISAFITLLNIFKKLWECQPSDKKKIKEIIEKILPKVIKTNSNYGFDIDLRIRNILLFLCNHEKYVPIASQNHKDNIWKNLSFLVGKTEYNTEYNEEDFNKILNEIKKTNEENGNLNGFYTASIRSFWDPPKISTNVNKDGDLPLNTLLVFKKAIVLYGPPGTSKTYTARELAKSVICTAFAENLKNASDKKESFLHYINNEKLIFDENDIEEGNTALSHIHRLQLHPNYTYDDFIVGKKITIEDNNTVIKTQNGYLLELIEKIKKDESEFKYLPHIVILDEINRVDISRVFGELFTAMESDYRKDGVDLPLADSEGKSLKLKVPENMYFIGTMNMIDFSLEQVDFALRRRFAWVESNYDEGRLKDIIEFKSQKNKIDLLSEDVENYISSCTSLNNKISNQMNLGPAYKIGHAFFSEIIDIYGDEQFKSKNNRWDTAKKFLWTISIKPMIEAYCGTMDSEMQKQYIDVCKNTFLTELKEEKNGNNQ